MMKFSFDEKTHNYTLDGKPLTGVTTILSVVAKPALIQWAANEAVNYIKINTKFSLVDSLITINLENFEKILEEARTAHRKKKEEAGSKGTDIHKEIETIIKGAIKNFNGYVQGYAEIEDSEQIKKFCNWATKNKVEFLESEKRVYSEKYWYAGTLDFVCTIGDKKFIGDIKTSSGIYPEHFWQMAAYRNAWEEMGEEKLDGAVVVNITKKGELNVEYSYFYQEDFETFLGALTIYKRLNQTRS